MKHHFRKIIALGLALVLAGMLGGCLGRPGETLTTEVQDMKQATLSFYSFDGGGPSFNAILEDPSLAEIQKVRDYGDTDPELVDGATFNVVFTFTGLVPGQTGLRIEERSPIAGNYDHAYLLTVGEDLTVSIEALEVTDLDRDEAP